MDIAQITGIAIFLGVIAILLIIIFILSAGASAFGTLVGGTSLITIPALILLGLPPHTAIGTDRFGIIGIGLAGFYKDYA